MSYLERQLAMAIFHKRVGYDMDFESAAAKDQYLVIARLALEGLTEILREPTQSMLDAGFSAFKHIGSDDTCKSVWDNMIAALAREQLKPVGKTLEWTR